MNVKLKPSICRYIFWLIIIACSGCSKKGGSTPTSTFYVQIKDSGTTYTFPWPSQDYVNVSSDATWQFGEVNDAILAFGVLSSPSNPTSGKNVQLIISSESNRPLTNGIGSYYFGPGLLSTDVAYYTNGTDGYISAIDLGASFPDINEGIVTVTSVTNHKEIDGTFTLNLVLSNNLTIKKTVTGSFKLPIK